jgi:hypothetical protein
MMMKFNSDIKITLGDFNATVGKEYIYKPTIGNESLHNETNNNGIKMIQFTISEGFNVDSKTANQIGHLSISNRF